MNLNFTKKLDFYACQTKVNIQKIDGSSLETFGMIIVFFLINDKARKPQFFEEIFC